MTYSTPDGQILLNTVDLTYDATRDGVLISGAGGSLWMNYEELDDAMCAVRREQYAALVLAGREKK